MDSIFFEKQDGLLCGQHALNALLQGRYFTAVDLADIARSIDQKERMVLGEEPTDHVNEAVFQTKSHNVDDSGYFSIQVLTEALKSFSLELLPLNRDSAAVSELIDEGIYKAFICNYRLHWFTIRKIGSQWFNLNSFLDAPQLISNTHLQLYLCQLQAEGYSIFVVEGALPFCTADSILEKNPVYPQQQASSQEATVDNESPENGEDGDLMKAIKMSIDDYNKDEQELEEALFRSREEVEDHDPVLQSTLARSLAEAEESLVRSAMEKSIQGENVVRSTETREKNPLNYDRPQEEGGKATVVLRTNLNVTEFKRKDPAEFMQLHGQVCKIHVEPSVYQSAESPAILRPWQGDPSVLIDRFDVRSHLDTIAEAGHDDQQEHKAMEFTWEERRCNYERYRILIVNEFEKIHEDKFLKQIYHEEHFGSMAHPLAKQEEAKKKHLADKRAAIAYRYEDSSSDVAANRYKEFTSKAAGVSRHEESDESDGEVEEEPELDVRVDVTELSNEDCKELNKIAADYQMQIGDFVRCMWEDQEEREKLQLLKDIEEEKANLAGKHSRRERKMLKELRLRERGRVTSPLSFLRKKEDSTLKYQFDESGSSGSSSENGEPNADETITYITSFGGETARDNGAKRKVLGPSPPPLSCKKRQQAKSHRSNDETQTSLHRFSSGHANTSRSSRSRSASRRLRKSSANKRCSYHSRSDSRSGSKSRRGHDGRSCEHSSSESSDDSRRRDSGSGHRIPLRGSSPPPSPAPGSVTNQSRPSPWPEGEGDESSESDLSLLSVRSSMSESEQERREVENAKRRLKRTKRELRLARKISFGPDSSGHADHKGRTLTLREKLKLQTQKALKKTLAKDKEDQRHKREEILREQIEREEEMRELSSMIRKKERERRHRELAEREKFYKRERDSSSSPSGSPQQSNGDSPLRSRSRR